MEKLLPRYHNNETRHRRWLFEVVMWDSPVGPRIKTNKYMCATTFTAKINNDDNDDYKRAKKEQN